MSTPPTEVLDPTNLNVSLSLVGLDKPCILIVRDSSEDVLHFLETGCEAIEVSMR